MANILVVDDHPDMREVVAQVLRLHKHNVSFADSGEVAWEQMQRAAPHAVVLDQRLPGISGMELLRRIRSEPALAQTEVVLYSGDDAEIDAAKEAGAHDFWIKGSSTIFNAIERFGKRLAGR